MKIGFDYQIFAQQKHGGISRYFASLARELSQMGEQARIIAPVHRNGYLADLPGHIVTGWQQDNAPLLQNRHVQRAINRIMTRLLLSAWRPDVVHETYYSPLRSGRAGTPTVVTVFDMIHELFPNEFSGARTLTALKRESVLRADHVICISASTRDDLIRLFGCEPDRITVIHLAAEFAPRTSGDRVAAHPGMNDPFILYVGARHWYKNFSGLLHAFAGSPRLRKDIRIAVVGGGSFSREETATIEGLGLGGRVTYLGDDDSMLDALYRAATALVYPSLYEGFGLPPLEAMARGCPVIASNTSSLPEVIGDAGELFDPADAGAMAQAIESVVYSDDRRRALISRGTSRVQRYSWRRCAEETLGVYRAMVSK